MRLAYISDQKFYTWGDDWFTTASFPLKALHKLFPYVDEWLIYGRLYHLAAKPRDLYCMTIPSDTKVRFQGPFGMPGGLKGYAGSSLSYLYGAHKAMMSSDIVWLKLPFVASIACLAAPKRGRIVLCQLVGDPESAGSVRGTSVKVASWLYSRLVSTIVPRCTFAVFVSSYLAGKYRSSRIPCLIANESRITEEMIVDSRDAGVHPVPRVLFVGRLSPEKGLATLLSALGILRGKTAFELWIVGSGEQLQELTDLAEHLGIKEHLRFFGRVPWGARLFEIMREADVLVLPSKTEGLSLVLVEAMSQGLPVVASRVGGIPEIITDGVSGLLVPPGSAKDLALALTRILTDQVLREKLVVGGLEVARRNTFEKQTGRIADVVERLVAHDDTVLTSLTRRDWH